MLRMVMLSALTLSAWSIAIERPDSEAQACHRRRCGGCYSGCGYGYRSNYGYANNCGWRGRSCYASTSCAPQYTTASNCGYVNSCGAATTYTNGYQTGTTGQYQGSAEDVAPPPQPAPNADGSLQPSPAPAPPPAAPAPGQP